MADGDRSQGEPRRLSVEERRWEWIVWHSELKPADKLILLFLFRMHIRYHEVYPSQEFLADRAGISVRKAKYDLARLERAGWFRREKRGKGQTKQSHSYFLQFPPWFSKDRDEFLASAKYAMLTARLDYRMDTDPACFDNWPDHDALMKDLEAAEKLLDRAP
jgi:hypothetical protein